MAYICMMYYPDEMREEGKRKSMLAAIRCCYVSNEQETYVRHQQQQQRRFFFPFLSFFLSFFSSFYSLVDSPRFFLFVCSVTYSTVRRVKAKRVRAITASVTTAIPKYLSSHPHHHYYSSINQQ